MGSGILIQVCAGRRALPSAALILWSGENHLVTSVIRRLALSGAAVILGSLLAGPLWASSVLDLSHIQDQTLDNGLRVIIKSEPYWRAVAIGVVIRSGSKDETDENSGVAHLIEHLLFEPSMPGKSLSLEVEDLGGYVHATTTADFTQITVAAASQFVPDLMPHLAETVFEAEFTTAQVEGEKQIILQEMQERYATVAARLDRMIWDLAFTKHPYRRPIPGTPPSLAQLSREQVQEFYEQHYVPSNAAVIVVGDLDPTSFFALARQHFGKYPAQARAPEQLPVEPPQEEIRSRIRTAEVPNTIIQYAWHAPGIADPDDVCAMDLIYTSLERGEISLLTQVLEAKELVLTSQVSFLTQKYPGLLIITAITTPEKELEARQGILDIIAYLREEQFSSEVLRYLKKLLYADYAFANQSYPDQVESLSFYEAIDSYRFACNYIRRVNDLTAEQIQQTARRYLGEDNYSLVIIRPQAALPPGDEV